MSGDLNNGSDDIDQATVLSSLHMHFTDSVWGLFCFINKPDFLPGTINLNSVMSAKCLWTGFVYELAESKSDQR